MVFNAFAKAGQPLVVLIILVILQAISLECKNEWGVDPMQMEGTVPVLYVGKNLMEHETKISFCATGLI